MIRPRSPHIFSHHTLAEEEPTAKIDGDRPVRLGRAHRVRLPDGYAVDHVFLKAFSAAAHRFSHADRRDVAAAASARKSLGRKRQISAACGNVCSCFGCHMNHACLQSDLLNNGTLAHSSTSDTRPRADLICPRRAFWSRRRARDPGVGRVGLRRRRTTAAAATSF